MTLKTCRTCGATKPLKAFHKNGSGRFRIYCKNCLRKRPDLAVAKTRAVKLWNAGMCLRDIARKAARNERTVSGWLNAAGIKTRERSKASMGGKHRGDAEALKPIGEAGGKWAEIDAVILRARQSRPGANPWPAQSSLV